MSSPCFAAILLEHLVPSRWLPLSRDWALIQVGPVTTARTPWLDGLRCASMGLFYWHLMTVREESAPGASMRVKLWQITSDDASQPENKSVVTRPGCRNFYFPLFQAVSDKHLHMLAQVVSWYSVFFTLTVFGILYYPVNKKCYQIYLLEEIICLIYAAFELLIVNYRILST